jgi:prepilin-type N-terminal cleavage/methylation domain-containing protein
MKYRCEYFFAMSRGRRRGLTLIESMLAMVILSIVGVGAGVGLQSSVGASSAVEDKLWASAQLSAKVESLRDTAYASLLSGATTSDVDRNGATYTITWTVLEIDPASPTSSPAVAKAGSGLKQITVSISGSRNAQSLVTWISQ